MRILIVHNRYRYAGGEDEVVRAEATMLEAHGHDVKLYQRDNSEWDEYSLLQKNRFIFKETLWSKKTYDEITALIDRFQPDVAHVHNIFLMVSPAVYDACFDKQIPVVQTLHNYRFFCLNGTLYRQNHICEDCSSGKFYPGIIHKCWQNSYPASWLLGRVIKTLHEKDYLKRINGFIAVSRFCQQKYLNYGFSPENFFVKPNFIISDPGFVEKKENFALFVGALREYKGISYLLQSWKRFHPFPLKIIGDGPLRKSLQKKFLCKEIEWLGQKGYPQTLEYIKKARCLILPSQCYETFSRVVIEAFACGTPVLVSRIGALQELIEDEKTGLLFESASRDAIEKCVSRFIALESKKLSQIVRNAREVYEEKFTAEKNYGLLMAIYQKVTGKTLEQKDSPSTNFAQRFSSKLWDAYFLGIVGIYILWRIKVFLTSH